MIASATALLFEIPRSQMNKDILLVQEIAQTALGAGYDGQAAGNRVLQFERRDNRVLLRGISNEIMASDTLSPVAGAVNASNVHPIIAIFNVEAYGPDSSAGDRRVAPLHDSRRRSSRRRSASAPATRSTRRVRGSSASAAFPDNVNVYSTLTLQQGDRRPRRGADRRRTWRRARRGFTAPTATIVMSYSFHRLPDVPMEPRLCDNRVGYFSLTVTDYAADEQRMASDERCFITRYRLEKKDPNAADLGARSSRSSTTSTRTRR